MLAVILLTNTNRIIPQLRKIFLGRKIFCGMVYQLGAAPPHIHPNRRRQGANIQRSLVQRFELQTGRTVDSLRRTVVFKPTFRRNAQQTMCFSKKTWDLGKRKGCERTKYIKTWIICRDHTWFYVNTTVISPKTNHFFSSQKETLLQCAHLTLSTGTIQHVLCLMLFRRSSWSKSSWATRKWWERWDCRQPLEW